MLDKALIRADTLIATVIIVQKRSRHVDSHREHRKHLLQVPALRRRRRARPRRRPGRADRPARIGVPRLRHRHPGRDRRPHPSGRPAGAACPTWRPSASRPCTPGPVTGARLIDDEVLAAMEAVTFLAPAHNPPYVAAMRSFRRVLPHDAARRAVRDGVLRPDARRRDDLRGAVRVEGAAGHPPLRVPRREPPRRRPNARRR